MIDVCVGHLQGFEIGREGERMQGLICRVYLERGGTFTGVEERRSNFKDSTD